MDDTSGENVYRMTLATWSGTFYNHMADDTDYCRCG